MKIGDTFKIAAFFDFDMPLQKSELGIHLPDDDYIIKGRMLNRVKDVAGERPIIPEMDWSYFDTNGFVKYEHDPIETTITKSGTVTTVVRPDPENIIGAPLKRYRINDQEEHLIGALFPQMDNAQKVVKLIKALRDHNSRFPNNQRTIGFSIEGRYTKRLASGDYAGKVINVVVTPNPQEVTTYLEQAQKSNLALVKSMEAGYGTNPDSQTGGGALRKEDLEGANSNKHSKSGEKSKMEKFSSRQEAYTAFRKQGKNHEDALKAVEEHFAKKAQARADCGTSCEKSLTSALDNFKKSIDGLTAFQSSQEQRAIEVASADAEIKKSIVTMDESKEIDGAKFIGTVGKVTSAVATMVREGQVELAKSISSIAAGLSEITNILKSMDGRVSTLEEGVDAANENVARVEVGLKKSQAGISLIDKGAVKVEGADNDDTPKGIALLKSVSSIKMQSYLVDRGAVETDQHKRREYFSAQETIRTMGVVALSKSIQDELVSHFTTS